MTRPVRQFAILITLLASGCALLKTERGANSGNQQTLRLDHQSPQDSDAPVRRIVRLQTSIATAQSDDIRLRSSAWEQLDEAGLMSPEDRLRLNQSGIRVGVSGGTLSWELTSLLQVDHSYQTASRTSNSPDVVSEQRVFSLGAHIALSEGSTSLLELPAMEGSLFVPSGEIAGLKNGAELQDARVVIEMTTIEHGDGWAVIRFLPQIHHGAITQRYNISNTGAQQPRRQKIQPLYEQQFEVKLHNEETVVIGCQHRPEWTIGRMMFQAETLSSKQEHLIALRLTGIEEVTGQKAMTVNYSRY
jgi:hypothetical protein